jgi:hypothetical protein
LSYLLFLDESGVDRRDSPYEVLAGVAIEDRRLWKLILRVQDAEGESFGLRLASLGLELKAKDLLKRKVYRLAHQMSLIPSLERRELARSCLQKGIASRSQPQNTVTRLELTALAQSKIDFVRRVLEICASARVKAFSSIVTREAPRPVGSLLRKDYAYLFERFYEFLRGVAPLEQGLVVFDELVRSQCHLLIQQMGIYFQRTNKGRERSSQVIPEPFFVHSDLTTGILIADLVAYLICWGLRFGPTRAPQRLELGALIRLLERLRYARPAQDGDPGLRGFKYLDDLRPRVERLGVVLEPKKEKRQSRLPDKASASEDSGEAGSCQNDPEVLSE